MSLRDAREKWRSYGGAVKDVRRTGEERYSHPSIERPIKVNKRRHDAPKILEKYLRKISKS